MNHFLRFSLMRTSQVKEACYIDLPTLKNTANHKAVQHADTVPHCTKGIIHQLFHVTYRNYKTN